MSDPFAFLGLRTLAPGGTVPPPSCTWVVGDWEFIRRNGPWCIYARSVTPSVAGCSPTENKPTTTHRERC